MPANADRSFSSTTSRLLLLGVGVAVVLAVVLFVRRAPDRAAAPTVTFRAFPSVPPLPGGETLIPCDLDGDGRGDFIIKNQPRPTVWLSRGDGSFDTIMFPFGGPTEIPLVPADLDGDKGTDFLLTDQTTRYLVLRGFDFVWPTGEFKPDPNALPAARIPPDGGGKPLLRQEGVFFGITYRDADGLVGPGAGASVVSGDLDGNRVADFLVQPGRDLPEPTEEPRVALGGELPWPRFYDPSRGYFADARAAAAAPTPPPEATSFAELRMNLITDKATVIKMAHSSALHGNYTTLIGGDFNGDKRLDFVRQPRGRFASGQGDGALVYFADTTGFRVERMRAANASAARVDSALGGDEIHLETGDFNGDGKTDLLWKRQRGYAESKARVEVWLSNGDGSFRVVEPAGSEPLWFAETTRLYVNDIDGDGRADLMVQDTRQPAASFPVRQVAAP